MNIIFYSVGKQNKTLCKPSLRYKSSSCLSNILREILNYIYIPVIVYYAWTQEDKQSNIIYICMYVCVYVCMYTGTGKKREKGRLAMHMYIYVESKLYWLLRL